MSALNRKVLFSVMNNPPVVGPVGKWEAACFLGRFPLSQQAGFLSFFRAFFLSLNPQPFSTRNCLPQNARERRSHTGARLTLLSTRSSRTAALAFLSGRNLFRHGCKLAGFHLQVAVGGAGRRGCLTATGRAWRA